MNRAAMDKMVADLQAIGSIKTVKIGLEPTLNPDDYPIIRIIPESLARTGDYFGRETTCRIYFAEPLQVYDGLIEIYDSLLQLNDQIIQILEASATTYSAAWTDTIMDSDQIQDYKVAMATFTVRTHCQ